MVKLFFNTHNIILQVVVSYNHRMQALVEGTIGLCTQHTAYSPGSVALASTRFWPAPLTDFRHTRDVMRLNEVDAGTRLPLACI